MNDEQPGPRCIVICHRGPGRKVKEILDTHRSSDPLRFILLFPTGQDGWDQHLVKKPMAPLCTAKISPLKFYAYHLQLRYDEDRSRTYSIFRYV